MNKIIPYGKQYITQSDIDSVVEVLKGDYLTQGPKIIEFEKAFAEYTGSKYAIAVTNGTAALHISLLALQLRPEDKVITTPITFAASANCIKYCGGEVMFCDIDPETFLIDLDKLEILLENHPINTFKGVVSVDFAGLSVDLERLRKIANKYKLFILQDSCHSPGGYFIDSNGNEQYCGNGKFADLTIFSFHPVKHIATGEGGMITTDNQELYERLQLLRTHGITKEQANFCNSIEQSIGDSCSKSDCYPGWYMEMQLLGFNYRITDIQAALGISQLKRAEEGILRRREIAKKYSLVFKNERFVKFHSGYQIGHAYHLYIIVVKEKRLELYNFLREKGIYTQVHYIPCHLMPFYQKIGWKIGDLPIAEEYYKGCLSLPMYPSLLDEEQNFVIQLIKEFYQ